jgi:nucleoside-diphosphate-sugar epimerase
VGRSGGNDIVCDLLDAEATRQLIVDHPGATVMHCAAAVPKATGDYLNPDTAADSLAMTVNLAAASPARLVYTSSMSVYPNGIGVAREDGAVAAASDYGKAKLRAEALLLDRQALVAIVLRLPGLFGGDRRGGVLYNAAASLAAGQAPTLAEALPQWAAMDVRDAAAMCVRALRAIMEHSIVINVGYPDAMSIGDAVGRLAKLFQLPPPEIASPVFAFDLSRMTTLLGPSPNGYQARLEQLAQTAEQDVKRAGHA